MPLSMEEANEDSLPKDENVSQQPSLEQVGDAQKSHIENQSNSLDDNPYAYLNRNGFTSEKFKIEIRNLPKYYGVKELKKLLNIKLSLKITKIKIPSPKGSRVYACFQNEEDRSHALKTLDGFKWKGCLLTANEAKPVPDPLVQKRILNSKTNHVGNETQAITDEKDLVLKIKNVTTPLWRTPYPAQLEAKTEQIMAILKQYGNQLAETNPQVESWWENQKEKYDGMPCQVLPIRHSEMRDGYRNKCEFTIGINDLTGERTVGFRLGSYVQGSTTVAPIDDVPSVPSQMKTVANLFQKFVRNSEYEVFNSELQQGYWKKLTVRLGFRTNELMIVVGIDSQQMTEAVLTSLKTQIKDYFTMGEGSSCRVHSLYLVRLQRKRSKDEEPIYEHIFGETHISEVLLGKTFRISPQAFFQVNTCAAEILYESVGELAGLTKDDSLLDVCCGTGTIGLSLAEKCAQVLGVEISGEAVADAKANAELNNVDNAEFYVGRAEDILGCVAHKAAKEEVVAVVDPPRAGLQHDAVVHIRKNERIKKLIYISCDPGRAIKNFVDFGRATSKIYRKEPFLPVRAVPVDLFPHTEHCELVIYLERVSGEVST